MASTMRALVATDAPSLDFDKIDIPKPASNQALIKISCVAQNPTDVQSLDAKAFGAGAIYGCDFTGTATEIGSSVSKIKKGDRIAGLIWGGEKKGLGGYCEYSVADEDIAFSPPANISDEEAATIPLAACTAWLAMFSKSCLAIPRKSGEAILVWGGSSSVGQFAIQLGRLEGLNVITTCSPKNFDLAKSLGAKHVFDYRAADVAGEIRKVAPKLKYVFDTIGNAQGSSATGAAAVEGKGKLCTVRPGKANTEDVPQHVEVSDVLVWTAFLSDHQYREFHWPASQEDHDLSTELFDQLPGWLERGDFKPNPVLQLKGLEEVPKGFDLYRNGAYSAQKLVYTL